MAQIYTEETLIQYYYNETDLFQSLEIEDAMENDFFLQESYLGIKSTLDQLNQTKRPSEKTINFVLEYSKLVHCLS